MQTNLTQFILSSPQRLAIPIGIYPGLQLIGKSVPKAVHDALIQANAGLALHERYSTPFLQTAMDLSIEAEAFGAQVRFEENEVPTIFGRLITRRDDLDMLFAPKIGHKRTMVPLNTVPILKDRAGKENNFVLGGMIGPFSLAGRLYGVSEALALTQEDPDLLVEILKRATNFLTRYAEAFRGIGADGIIVAEPAAGLMSPKSLAKFSAPFMRQMVSELQTGEFTFIYHNCGAKLVHLDELLTDGAAIHHFGKPMDIIAALERVDNQTILAGNLDPAGTFIGTTAEQVYTQTMNLLQATAGRRNFLLSSGCDLPPATPLENLDAFYQAVADFNRQ